MPNAKTPYSDLDKMLAEHDALYGDRNDTLLTGHPDPAPFLHRNQPRPEPPAEPDYGEEPRQDWPKASRHWTPELLAERRYWVKRFVGEQGLNFKEAANIIGVHDGTVRADAEALGFPVGSTKPGRKTLKVQRLEARRVEVRRLFEQNLGVPEIAEQLGVHTTTIYKDLQDMGLSQPVTRIVNRKAVGLVSNALTAMDDMAQLLLNLPELEILQVDDEQAKVWLKQLRRIARGAGRVRKTTKGTKP